MKPSNQGFAAAAPSVAAPETPEERCHILFHASQRCLEDFARRAARRGLDGNNALLVCIEVDSIWRDLVDVLMPGHDWQPLRDAGEVPFARGTSLRQGVVEIVSAGVPALAGTLRRFPPVGLFHAVVLVEGCGAVFLVRPSVEPS